MTATVTESTAVIEVLSFISGSLAVVGVLANNRRLRWCFPVWWASNALSAALHAHVGMWSLMARDLVFLALAVEGWRRWAPATGTEQGTPRTGRWPEDYAPADVEAEIRSIRTLPDFRRPERLAWRPRGACEIEHPRQAADVLIRMAAAEAFGRRGGGDLAAGAAALFDEVAVGQVRRVVTAMVVERLDVEAMTEGTEAVDADGALRIAD